MPTLLDSHASSTIKMLNIGESGTGKTGACASLAKAGYRLWVLDYDAGFSSQNPLLDALSGDREAMGRVNYETLRDTITTQNGLPKVKAPTHAYKAAGRVLTEWKVSEFTPQDIIILDSLTTFSDAAFNEALSLGARLNQRPQLQDFGWCADSVKLFIEMLTSPELNAHVIVNSHIRYLASEGDEAIQRGLPNAKGQEISRVVSRYFNTVVLSRTLGSGAGARRRISTQPQGVVEVKTSSPSKVKPDYPIDTGLSDLFADILGHRGPKTTTTTKETQHGS